MLLCAADDADDTLRERMSCFRHSQKLCDIVVHVEGRDFHAHRVVLASESAFFDGLLTSGCPETDAASVALSGEAASIFEHVLSFVYDRRCRIASEEELIPLLEAACRLQVRSLQAATEEAFIERLVPENAAQALGLGDRLSLLCLTEKSQEFTLKHFSAVLAAGAIAELSADHLTEVLASDDLQLDKEEDIQKDYWRLLVRIVETKAYPVPAGMERLDCDASDEAGGGPEGARTEARSLGPATVVKRPHANAPTRIR